MPPRTRKEHILLLFYRPSPTDAWLNRLVAHFDPPFCHVEMAFPERYGAEPWETEIWGSSIFQGEPVFFRKRTYQRDGYVSFAIEVTRAQQMAVREYCIEQARLETPFDRRAMYAAYLPFQLFPDGRGTFCSKHICNALRSGGVSETEALNPSLTTPSFLYRYLTSTRTNDGPIVQVVPSRMYKMPTEGNQGLVKALLQPGEPHAQEPLEEAAADASQKAIRALFRHSGDLRPEESLHRVAVNLLQQPRARFSVMPLARASGAVSKPGL